MCKRRRSIPLLVCAILVTASAAEAQTTASVRARFVALSDSAAALSRVIQARNAREAPRRPAPDTLWHEGLTVVTIGPMPPELRPAVPLAWRTLVQHYGAETARTAAPVEVIALPGTPPTLSFRSPTIEAQRGRTPPPIGRLATTSRDTLAEVIAAIAGRPFWKAADSVLTAWRETADPVWTSRSVNLEDLHVQLVTTPWTMPARCYQGDLASCRAILGLDPRHVLIASFTPDERVAIVSRDMSYASSRVLPAWINGCVNGRDPALCDKVLTQTFPEPWSHRGALRPPGRLALLAVALETGGSGAFGRLLESPEAPIEQRLAYAAGISPDSLVARWRNEILAARPPHVGVTPRGGWAAMGWITLLGMLALRSSRWR